MGKFFPKIVLIGFLAFIGLTGYLNVALADSINQEEVFNVDSGYDYNGRSQITATLRSMGQYIYLYVDNEYWSNLNSSEKRQYEASLNNLADKFDNVIYPKERAVFGSEWTPGIDNDERITVLVSKLDNDAGGYIKIYDEYSASVYRDSNEREMFYLNALFVNQSKALAFMAHEFQHLITFYQKTKLYGLEEEVWLNEARSEYAPTLCGFDNPYLDSNLAERVDIFLDQPSDSLTEWKNKLNDYGQINLFIQYLVSHYGQEVLTKMVLNNKVGIDSVNQALAKTGHSETFSDIFSDWIIANYFNDCDLGDKYCYLDNDLDSVRVDPTATYGGFPELNISRGGAVKDWTAAWYRFLSPQNSNSQKDVLRLEFDGNQNDFEVAYAIIGQDNQTTINFLELDQDEKGTAYIDKFISAVKSIILMPFSREKNRGFSSREPVRGFSFLATSVEESGLSISSILPKSGPATGGFEVTISGNVFSSDNQVKFGNQFVDKVTYVNSNELKVIAPATEAGSVKIQVIKGDQIASLNGFSYQTAYPDGSLLRARNGYKVYVIEGHYKRWMQDAEIFNAYGHLSWDDIIEVDQGVLDSYQEAWLIRAAGDKRVYEVNANGTKHWLNMTANEFNQSGRLWDMVFIVNSFERVFYKTGSGILFQ